MFALTCLSVLVSEPLSGDFPWSCFEDNPVRYFSLCSISNFSWHGGLGCSSTLKYVNVKLLGRHSTADLRYWNNGVVTVQYQCLYIFIASPIFFYYVSKMLDHGATIFLFFDTHGMECFFFFFDNLTHDYASINL